MGLVARTLQQQSPPYNNKPMNIATVVLTAPRPKPTLDRTVASLDAAGFPAVSAFNDAAASGHFRAWMNALQWIVSTRGDADAYFVVEDDTVFCRGLQEYLQHTLWPGRVEHLALCSPYCPKAYRQPQPGWDATQSGRGYFLAGSQAWILPARIATAVLAEVAPLNTENNAAWEIGRWAKAARKRVWYHTPSLVQHIGLGNSALGDDSVCDIRHAVDFIGEDAYPGTPPT